MMIIHKLLKEKDGFTIVEFIAAMSVMTFFFLGVTLILASGSQIYLRESIAENSQEVIETISKDIQNYVMYGEDIRVFYRIAPGENTIAGKQVTNANSGWFTDGTEVYLDPEDQNKLIFDNMQGTINSAVLPSTAVGNELIAKDFYGNGIDLGYKKIYLSRKADGTGYIGTSIKGLSYGEDYYKGMSLSLIIRDKAIEELDTDKKGIYSIEVGGNGRLVTAKSLISIKGLNEKD